MVEVLVILWDVLKIKIMMLVYVIPNVKMASMELVPYVGHIVLKVLLLVEPNVLEKIKNVLLEFLMNSRL